ncbi:MAG: cytochrome c3 family protein [bacterium]
MVKPEAKKMRSQEKPEDKKLRRREDKKKNVEKRVVLILVFLSFCLLLFLSFPLSSFAIDAGSDSLAHNTEGPAGVCSNCHIPHKAKGKRLWARELPPEFAGVRQLCHSCHDGTIASSGLQSSSGLIGSVFDKDEGEDHVMHDWAEIIASEKIIPYNSDIFPLDITDEHEYPKCDNLADAKRGSNTANGDAGEGFYCGSCHDVHRQPKPGGDSPVINGDGDYLRIDPGFITTLDKLGQHGNRKDWCDQCHGDKIKAGRASGHGTGKGCLDCHHPHEGDTNICDDSYIGQLILIKPLKNFNAVPNAPNVSGAAACYGCHEGLNGFSDTNYEHHPMGEGADTSQDGHASCTNKEDVFTCSSCHDVHDGTNDAYIRTDIIYSYEYGKGAFCIVCHCDDKKISDLGLNGGHKQSTECSFCHSMHRSQGNKDATYQTTDFNANEDNSAASVDTIMRIDPVNLQWADKMSDTDVNDYEDACYGCHSDNSICPNANLATKINQGLHSHRFNAQASQKINVVNPFNEGKNIVSDGDSDNVVNDYGVKFGNIYCGSCHSVHNNHYSPYLRSDNTIVPSDLCERCHTNRPGHSFFNEHPVGQNVVPKTNMDCPTFSPFPPDFTKGSTTPDGPGGKTYDGTPMGGVICETCHRVHTAATDYTGNDNVNAPFMPLPNNNIRTIGSKINVLPYFNDELCKACHNCY